MNKIFFTMSAIREIQRNKTLHLDLRFPFEIGKITNVKICINRSGESKTDIKILEHTRDDNCNIFTGDIIFDGIGKYDFYFTLEVNGEFKSLKYSYNEGKAVLVEHYEDYPYWSILVTNEECKIPQEWQDQIVYQIFIDRFCNITTENIGKYPYRNYRRWYDVPDWKQNENGDFHNNDFFCGNLKGIISKLEYLKSLHIDVIYISPITYCSYRYERYAATDHLQIDPDAGTFDDLEQLYQKAKSLGIKLILDIALNHCNSDNKIFIDAKNNPNSQYRDWFHFDQYNNYQYWFGMFSDMPIFNQHSKGLQDYIYGDNNSVVSIFSKYVDGFRLDVANELQDFFLEGIRKCANKHKKTIIYGEYWQPPHLGLYGKGLDGFTNYSFSDAIIRYIVFGNHLDFKGKIKYLIDSIPQESLNTSLVSLDTHDTMRSLNMLMPKFKNILRENPYDFVWDIDKMHSIWHSWYQGNIFFDTLKFRKFAYENMKCDDNQYGEAKKRLKISALIQFFLPGNPCIFYGTEAGIQGFKDPFNRTCYPWNNQDFELIEFYTGLSEFRKVFKSYHSIFEILEITENFVIFKRANNYNTALIAVNRSTSTIDLRKYTDIFNDYDEESKMYSVNNATIDELPPLSGFSLIK